MQLADAAMRCSLAASLAYLTPAQRAATRREWRHTGPFVRTDPGQEYASRLARDFTFAEEVREPSLEASATIFESTVRGEEELMVAFRGSTAIRNFRSMFAVGFTPLNGDPSCKVHTGYHEASLKLYEQLLPAIERRAVERITFTGHSYGGGTATLCALMHSPDQLVTFSAPQIGDDAFATKFDATPMGERTFHLVHDADPVLQQNRPLWDALGYAHTGRVVRCSSSKAVLFEERASGSEESGSGVAWNLVDHCRYLGTYMGPRIGKIRWTKYLKPNYSPRG